MKRDVSIMVLAGEVSGDMHAAAVVHSIKQRCPQSSFFGVGGDNLRAAGMEILYDVEDMGVTGIVEVLRRFWFFRSALKSLVAIAGERRPDLVLMVDYPGFNLRFAARLKGSGIKIIHYVCPQVWAWNQSRIPMMAKNLDHLITIFPFEAKYFENTDLKVTYAGHPLADEAAAALKQPLLALPWRGERRVALLPGSRRNEVERMLPTMWRAALAIAMEHNNTSFIIACPSPAVEELVQNCLKNLPHTVDLHVEVVTGKTRQVLRQAEVAVVASGTATIEAALMQCPMVIVYKTAALTYAAGRLLIKIKNIGMVNIVAGKTVCPELIQGAATPNSIARLTTELLNDTQKRIEMIRELKVVTKALGKGGAEERVADTVLREMKIIPQPRQAIRWYRSNVDA